MEIVVGFFFFRMGIFVLRVWLIFFSVFVFFIIDVDIFIRRVIESYDFRFF